MKPHRPTAIKHSAPRNACGRRRARSRCSYGGCGWSAVLVSVSGAVGAVGGSGGGQGLVCGFSPDLLADLLAPEHAELEMLDLTVGSGASLGSPWPSSPAARPRRWV